MPHHKPKTKTKKTSQDSFLQAFFDDRNEDLFNFFQNKKNIPAPKIKKFIDEFLILLDDAPPKFPNHLTQDLLAHALYQCMVSNDTATVKTLLDRGADPFLYSMACRFSGCGNAVEGAISNLAVNSLPVLLAHPKLQKEKSKIIHDLITHYVEFLFIDDHPKVKSNAQLAHQIILKELGASDLQKVKPHLALLEGLSTARHNIDDGTNFKLIVPEKIIELIDTIKAQSPAKAIAQIDKEITMIVAQSACRGKKASEFVTKLCGLIKPLAALKEYGDLVKDSMRSDFDNWKQEKISMSHLRGFEAIVACASNKDQKEALKVVQQFKGWDQSLPIKSLHQSIEIGNAIKDIAPNKSSAVPRKM